MLLTKVILILTVTNKIIRNWFKRLIVEGWGIELVGVIGGDLEIEVMRLDSVIAKRPGVSPSKDKYIKNIDSHFSRIRTPIKTFIAI